MNLPSPLQKQVSHEGGKQSLWECKVCYRIYGARTNEFIKALKVQVFIVCARKEALNRRTMAAFSVWSFLSEPRPSTRTCHTLPTIH